ncbi:putative vacuolar membrane protein [Diplonema papillatum]|nr:putative vacuolar membrane protein [Diplonema papillatum]
MKGAEYGEDGMTSKTPLLGHSKVAVYGGAAGGVAGADMVADTPSQSYMTPMWAPSGFDRDTVQHFTLDGGEPQYPPSQAGSVHGMPTSNDPGQVTRFLAAILAGLVSVVDNAPYGLVLFPLEIREEYKGVGVAMVLTSCAISQVVFTWTSVFPCAVGCMVVENLPFLARLGRDVYSDLKARGREDQVLPTLLFCFALSTVLSGITMLLLGRARLGKLTAYFPKHVLLGYVGGMGVFIFTAGFEITTDRTWTWNPFALLRSVYGPPGSLLAVTLALVAAIPVLKRLTRNSTLTLPLFFLAIPCFFWAILLSYGLTAQHAKDNMWVITVGSAPGLPGLLPWVMVNPFLIAWDVVASQMFTIVGIVLFTMLHVPVNVPALSLTCGRPCYIDAELSSQGIANIVCGCFGALQCYLVYGVSALYFKCGGGGKKESLIIASIVLFFAAAGETP